MMEIRGLTLSDAGKWFITTELFERDGRVIAGPFSTRGGAITARETVEKDSGNMSYWIDQAPQTIVSVTDHYRAAYDYAETVHSQAPRACHSFASFYMSGHGMDRQWIPGDPIDAVWKIWVAPA